MVLTSVSSVGAALLAGGRLVAAVRNTIRHALQVAITASRGARVSFAALGRLRSVPGANIADTKTKLEGSRPGKLLHRFNGCDASHEGREGNGSQVHLDCLKKLKLLLGWRSGE